MQQRVGVCVKNTTTERGGAAGSNRRIRLNFSDSFSLRLSFSLNSSTPVSVLASLYLCSSVSLCLYVVQLLPQFFLLSHQNKAKPMYLYTVEVPHPTGTINKSGEEEVNCCNQLIKSMENVSIKLEHQ